METMNGVGGAGGGGGGGAGMHVKRGGPVRTCKWGAGKYGELEVGDVVTGDK
jgi:hypothetical protein